MDSRPGRKTGDPAKSNRPQAVAYGAGVGIVGQKGVIHGNVSLAVIIAHSQTGHKREGL